MYRSLEFEICWKSEEELIELGIKCDPKGIYMVHETL